nr:hypothetical protein Iba_chr02cCG1280 [Ipomoea batatas]
MASPSRSAPSTAAMKITGAIARFMVAFVAVAADGKPAGKTTIPGKIVGNVGLDVGASGGGLVTLTGVDVGADGDAGGNATFGGKTGGDLGLDAEGRGGGLETFTGVLPVLLRRRYPDQGVNGVTARLWRSVAADLEIGEARGHCEVHLGAVHGLPRSWQRREHRRNEDRRRSHCSIHGCSF